MNASLNIFAKKWTKLMHLLLWCAPSFLNAKHTTRVKLDSTETISLFSCWEMNFVVTYTRKSFLDTHGIGLLRWKATYDLNVEKCSNFASLTKLISLTFFILVTNHKSMLPMCPTTVTKTWWTTSFTPEASDLFAKKWKNTLHFSIAGLLRFYRSFS